MRYEFADCVLDTASHSLERAGTPVAVEPQVYDLLLLLTENAGELVSREQIVETVWQGRIVSESAISARIAATRKAVGDDGKAQRIIQTVARRGLRFVAPVRTDADTATPPSPPSKGNDAPPIRYARAEDGATIGYCLHGEGPPLVWIGPFPSDQHKNWTSPSERPLIDALSSRFRLLRYDQRGCGLSEVTLTARTLETEAEDLRALVDAAGFDRFALFAESGSSLIAATFAALWPERVTRLAIVGGYVEGRDQRSGATPVAPEVIRRMLEEGWNTPNSAFVTAFLAAYFPEGPSDVVRYIGANMQHNAPLESVLIDRDMLNTVTIADRLDHVTMPVLVMHSRHDGVHPLQQAQRLTAGLPDAELVVLDTANHVPLPGHHLWDSYITTLIDFLARD